jgi:hypothetical protein
VLAADKAIDARVALRMARLDTIDVGSPELRDCPLEEAGNEGDLRVHADCGRPHRIAWRQQSEARLMSRTLLGYEQHCQHCQHDHGDVVVPCATAEGLPPVLTRSWRRQRRARPSNDVPPSAPNAASAYQPRHWTGCI